MAEPSEMDKKDKIEFDLRTSDPPGPEPDTGFDLMALSLDSSMSKDQVRNAARWLMAAAQESTPDLMNRVLQRLGANYPVSTVIGVCGLVIHGMGHSIVALEGALHNAIDLLKDEDPTESDDPPAPDLQQSESGAKVRIVA